MTICRALGVVRLCQLAVLLGFFFSQVAPQPPQCTPDNFKLAEASKGKWFLLPDGSMQYEVDHCQLRRFSSSEASECLGGANLLLMGDSIARYLYLTLTYFLTNGRWPPKFAKVHHPEFPPSMVWEKDHGSFFEFYEETNKAMTKGTESLEICDCYRIAKGDWPEIVRTSLENRFYRHIPNSNLNDQEHDVRLNFLSFNEKVRGHKRLSSYPRNESFLKFAHTINEEFCPVDGSGHDKTFIPYQADCGKRREELHNHIDTLDYPPFSDPTLPDCNLIHESPETNECQRFEREVFQGLDVTHVMLNLGWHSSLRSHHPLFLPKLLDAAKRYMKPVKSSKMKLSKVIWRSSTYGEKFEEGEEVAHEFRREHALDEDFDYFDIYNLTKVLKEDYLAIKLTKKSHNSSNIITISDYFKPHPILFYKEEHPGNITYRSGYVDAGIHFEPWVNIEILTLFFNAVCY